MDAPVETQLLDLDSDARHARNELPELSPSQSGSDCPSLPPSRTLSKRKSLRARPTDLLEQQHAVPPLPLRTYASQPELRPRSSKMSLFSLFSKPKVEKLRGYAEAGLETPPRASSHSVAPPTRKGSIGNGGFGRGPTRPATSASQITRKPVPPPVLQTPNDDRTFEPLPWFQVLPQAIQYGTFEASMIAPDVVLQKNRQRTTGSMLNPAGRRGSAQDNDPTPRRSGDSKAAARTTFKSGPVAMKSEDSSKVSNQVFVLTTSGYLLQYADTAASDRLPERILKLDKDSAAFASDLIPGRHHVLQVSQAVDSQGELINDRQSIFSKFSLRSHAPKRMVSNFLIVMPGAQELSQWLTAIRQEIQKQGGKEARSDSPPPQRPTPGDLPKLDLRKTPSQSHRYQVRRDPTKVLSVISPLSDTFAWFPTPLASPADASSRKLSPFAEEPLSRSETDSVQTRSRAPSESLSLASSTGQSVEHHQLETLRDSTRISHTSTAATVSTIPSRSNSLTSSPPPEQAREFSEGHTTPQYRSLSSYTLAKRRTAVPIALKSPTLSASGDPLPQHSSGVVSHSAETPRVSPKSKLAPPALKRLTMAHSVPNLRIKLDRHDSKVASPVSPTRDRPDSFLGALPDANSYMTRTSPSHHRTSFAQNSPVREMHVATQARPISRSSSHTYGLQLRQPALRTTSIELPRRTSEDEDVLSPIPAVHTLNAKVDIAERTSLDATHIPPRGSSFENTRRLSLFPTTEAVANQRRQPDITSPTLRRPFSLQVRTGDQAAFLSSSRTYPPSPRTNSQQRSTTTVPIKRLKPSRSFQTFPSDAPSKTNPYRQSSLMSTNEGAPYSDRRPSLPVIFSGARTRSSIIPGYGSVPLGPPAPPPRAPLPELPPPGARSRSKSPMPMTVRERRVAAAIAAGKC